MEGQSYRPNEEQMKPNKEVDFSENHYADQVKEVKEDDLTYIGVKTDPEARLRYVLEAAEHDLEKTDDDPLSLRLERRQEVKDDTKGGMTAVRDVVADKLPKERNVDVPAPEPHITDQFLKPQPKKSSMVVAEHKKNPQPAALSSLYRLAVLWGFIVAILVVLVVMIVWTLTG